jgi:hypothetical protein
VAAVDDVRGGEAHIIEEVDAAEESMRKVAELIVAPDHSLHACLRGRGARSRIPRIGSIPTSVMPSLGPSSYAPASSPRRR